MMQCVAESVAESVVVCCNYVKLSFTPFPETGMYVVVSL